MAGPTAQSIDEVCVNTIRTLCIDAVQQANSGHPGTPMAMAPVVYTLWQDFLRFDPEDPIWPNRDRFVLSSGHASTLLYSMLHLTGVKAVDEKYERLGTPTVALDDLKKFRQLDSKCPGHPEYHWTSGVETTTGPLGQGIATSVGMAIGANWLASHFNRPDFKLFDYDVYALCGDGCMMEGVASEAASLAGHLKLGNLCWIYDSNHITIEGNTALAFTEDVAGRFHGLWLERACGSATPTTASGSPNAIAIAKRIDDRPTPDHRREPYRLRCAAQAGHLGRPRRAARRGRGQADQAQLRLARGRAVPGARRRLRRISRQNFGARGAEAARANGMALFERYQAAPSRSSPSNASRCSARDLPEGWDKDIPVFPADPKGIASRDSSGQVLNAIAPNLPWLVGGAADLAPSTKTRLTFDGAGDFAGGELRRPQFSFRHPRARDGGDLQRPRAVEIAAVRLGLSDLLGLREAADPPRRDHGTAGRLRLHARFDRGRRRRPDASADRAAGRRCARSRA